MNYTPHFILISLFFLFAGCSSEEEQAKALAKEQVYPIETGTGVEILYTDSGLPKAIVKAPLIERFAGNDRNYTEMRKGIDIRFLNRQEQVESFLTADYAINYDIEKKMIARKKVVVRNIDGDTLRTEELIWNVATQRVSSDKYVTITTKDELIMGDGFESDISFKNPKIYKIRGIVTLK
jgi:LPS export ABC transporter protein LptC